MFLKANITSFSQAGWRRPEICQPDKSLPVRSRWPQKWQLMTALPHCCGNSIMLVAIGLSAYRVLYLFFLDSNLMNFI